MSLDCFVVVRRCVLALCLSAVCVLWRSCMWGSSKTCDVMCCSAESENSINQRFNWPEGKLLFRLSMARSSWLRKHGWHCLYMSSFFFGFFFKFEEWIVVVLFFALFIAKGTFCESEKKFELKWHLFNCTVFIQSRFPLQISTVFVGSRLSDVWSGAAQDGFCSFWGPNLKFFNWRLNPDL